MTDISSIEQIAQAVMDGEVEVATDNTRAALEAGLDPLQILNDGLMAGADEVGKRFERGEYFLPELLLAGRALKAAMEVLNPSLAGKTSAAGSWVGGRIVIATVQTDIHDIGKNIVASMLTAAGYNVTDLGVDVPLKSIVDRAEEVGARVIALSVLLTTSMPYIKDLIGLLTGRGLREKYIVVVGGASVTEAWARSIGADGTARNAAEAVKLVRGLLKAA
ncbi:cobalamin-binding protein [bacterium]|nr:MAG: cobalamin-binding protein [bacterium]